MVALLRVSEVIKLSVPEVDLSRLLFILVRVLNASKLFMLVESNMIDSLKIHGEAQQSACCQCGKIHSQVRILTSGNGSCK